MDISRLPRDDSGMVVGRWRLRHRLAGFTESFGPFAFQDGVSTAPLTGLTLERAIASFGELVDIEPWDEAPAEAPVPEPQAMHEPEPLALPQADAATPTPTTLAELKTLVEADLRAVAAELGCTDKRWKPERLRRFIAAELELGLEEDDASTE